MGILKFTNHNIKFDYMQQQKKEFLKQQKLKSNAFFRYEVNPFVFNQLAILKIISFKQMALLNIIFNMNKNSTLTNICKLYGLNKQSTKRDLEKLQNLSILATFDSGMKTVGKLYYVQNMNICFKLVSEKLGENNETK